MKRATNGAWTPEDHDILIEVRTLVNRLVTDFREYRDQIASRIAEVDVRLRAIEDLSSRLDPTVAHHKYDVHLIEWQDFRSRLKAYGAMIIGASAVIGWILNYLLPHK